MPAAVGASARAGLRRAPPLVCAAAGWLVGDVSMGVDTRPAALVLAGVAGAAGWMLVAVRGAEWRRAGLALLAAVAGALAADRVYHPRFPPDHIAVMPMGAPLDLEAELLADAVGAPARVRVLLAVTRVDDGGGWRPARGRLLLTLGTAAAPWIAGDRVVVRTVLHRPRNFGNPGEFDYEGYLARRDIYVTAFATDDGALTRLPPAAGGAPGSWLARWRRRVGALFTRVLPQPQAAVLGALIVGTADAIPQPVRTAFSRAGVSHVLSISGLHVALVASAGYALCRWLLARSRWVLLTVRVPQLAVALSIVPVVLYAGLAGGNVATTRSVIMILVVLGAVLVGRQRHAIVSLAVAALLVLASSPGAARDISFQLSFVAVLGLLLGMERFWPWWAAWEEAHLLRLRGGWARRLWRALATYLVVSASALAATTPLTALHFNQVSLVAPLANAVVVPLLGSAAVTLGLLAALLEPLWEPAAWACTWLAGPCVSLGLWCVGVLAAIPYAAVRIVTPTGCELLLLYAGLWVLVRDHGRTRRRRLAVLALLAAGDAAWWDIQRYHRAALQVTHLSVGQGDAAVVELPGAAVMVIDGGGSAAGAFDVGERVIAPFLWSRKIAHVDYLVLSHPQADHAGGLAFLAEQFSPHEFWSNEPLPDAAAFLRLRRALAAPGLRQFCLRRGASRRLGATEAVVLGPPASADAWSGNNRSLVLGLRYGGVQLLFPGDIERRAEDDLLRSAGAALASAVLKVPHHGSRTSSSAAFLAAVAPRAAVVSAGGRNAFGMPHAEVVARYAARRCPLARTDRDGAVTVRIDAHGALRIAGFRRRIGVDSTAGGG